MSVPYKLVAFDLDGTLAESKQPITEETASLLHRLSLETKVVVISGGSFARFEEQLLRPLERCFERCFERCADLSQDSPKIRWKNIILLPTEGSERFEYDIENKKWKMTDRQTFPEKLKKEVVRVLDEIIASGKYEIPLDHQGEYIEDRDTEITFSALGQEADLKKKEAWDPDRAKRFKIKEALEEKFHKKTLRESALDDAGLSDINVSVAGTTSIDILPKGFDKARGLSILLEKLKIAPEEVVFIGDAIVPGGNDYSVLEAGIRSLSVESPNQTADVIRKMLQPIFPSNPIAYFCAEYALDSDPSMYAGGLGILAGDYVLEAAGQNIPFIAIGLRYGKSIPAGFVILENTSVEVPIGNEMIKAKVWHRSFSTNVHVLLLDTDTEENAEENRKVTSHLYDTDFYTRVKQQMVLGIGGIRLLSKLGISPKIYHLNEGHTAFAAVAIMVEKKADLGKIVATKHTILSEAGLQIKFSYLDNLIGTYCKEFGCSTKKVFDKGKFELNTDLFSTTKFVIVSAVKKNGVSALHTEFEKKRHPHSTLISITNGVYRKRWQASEFIAKSASFSAQASELSDTKLWNIKRKLKKELFDHIENVSGERLNTDICTLVWARRFAQYKRSHLLFSDVERLKNILLNPNTPLQCVISGKTHENDTEAENILEQIISFTKDPSVKGRVVYLPDYSILSAEKLTRGADLWLNTPELGKEACGTSGMKAGLNGALQCSVRDGWVGEVNWAGRGWIFDTVEMLYDLLEHEILPCFYEDSAEAIPSKWIKKMRSTIELVEKSYTAERMLHDYEEKLYKL